MKLSLGRLPIRFLSVALLSTLALGGQSWGAPTDDYGAADDAHNHDGSHPAGVEDCGSNYMLPGATARLGSHSFIILGEDGPDHIIADHRSGTPPHNYHFILRVRLDADEMAFYRKLKSESKLPPAFTTIYFDDATGKKQLNRTFFCLADLPKIFGDQQKAGDVFASLFPIRASLQKDADHEGAFPIESTIYPGGHLTIDRADVEILVFKYLPAYLPQNELRAAIEKSPSKVIPLLDDAPIAQTDPRELAEARKSYTQTDARLTTLKKNSPETCVADFYLKGVPRPKTVHAFLLLNELPDGRVLAVHYYDQSPHNFQAAIKLKLDEAQRELFRRARVDAKAPPLFLTYRPAKGKIKARGTSFCMADLRELVKDPSFVLHGAIYRDPGVNEYRRGAWIGDLDVTSSQIEVIVNRPLLSLLDPREIAKDVRRK